MEHALPPRTKALDGLRGLAVLQVVTYHLFLLPLPVAGVGLYFERLGRAIDGLTLFFTLSGFLLGGILLDARGTEGVLRVFYLRRACRILPLYALLLASYGVVRFLDIRFQAGLIYYWYSDVPFWNYVVFLQNYRMVHDQVLGAPWLAVTWSLAVEQQFYLILPWFVLGLGRWALVILAAAVVAFGFAPHSALGFLLTDRLDALAAGVLFAAVMRVPTVAAWLSEWRRALRVVVLVYFAAVTVLVLMAMDGSIRDRWPVTAVAYGLTMVLLSDGTPWPGVKTGLEWLAPLGTVSYFVYLFHIPILYLLQHFWPVATWLALPLTLGAAALSFRFFEQPLIRWGHRFRYGAPKPAAIVKP